MDNINIEVNDAIDYMENNVSSILQELTLNLMKEKPKNISLFCSNYLKNNKTDIKNKIEKKINSRPEGVESSEEDDDDYFDEEMESKHLKIQEKKKPRISVSAEVYGKFNEKKKFVPKNINKSDEDKLRINNLLKNSFMFMNLEEEEKNILINVMGIKEFNKDEVIIQEGESGNVLYIIEKGTLKCTKKIDGMDKFLLNYSSGDVFGELALLYNTPRQATITSETEGVLYSLDRETFNNIVKDAAIKRRNDFEDFINNFELLKSLNNYEREKLCDCLKIENYKKDDLIINQGDSGDKFYLVIDGQAQAFKYNVQQKKNVLVFEYEKNTYFGELSLLRDSKRAASIVATTDLKLASIDRKSFKRLLGSLEKILERNTEIYNKYIVKE